MDNYIKIKVGEKSNNCTIPMGGSDSKGNVYGVNTQYLVKNGKPILPVMGEFHFSRYPENEWEKEILKMKAGGVEVLATYVFWIHHEQIKGEWNFEGRRNIRKFLEICSRVDMPVWLRIGPWAHGECRNGGFPEWLVKELQDNGFGNSIYGEPIHEARTNDELYMKYVRSFWERLSIETKGMMCKDGGPVIGIQLENEYCHAGGPRDKNRGFEHMRALKALAIELGFVTPYYTATGWGGAVVLDNETLPVWGGYVDAPWERSTEEMPASENFLMKPFGNLYLTAELGGGLQVTEHRRTYPYDIDIEAQSICMLGSGANLLGYYMYHGGVNPESVNPDESLQESLATGYFSNLPIKSYDFEAPIHESGKLNGSYGKLKKIHLLTKSFGESIAPAKSYFPDIVPQSPEDMDTPRISARYNHDTGEGFLFVNNHQRLRKMKPIRNLEVRISLPDGSERVINNINFATDSCMVIPFGFIKTNAALLAKAGGNYYFYYDDEYNSEKPYFEYEKNGLEHKVILLTKAEAEKAYIFDDKLYISDKPLFEKKGEIYMLIGNSNEKVRIYGIDGEPTDIEVTAPKELCETRLSFNEENNNVYNITFEINEVSTLNEIYLNIDFNGDKAELYSDGKLLTDWFSNGDDWNVALKRYGYPKDMQLVVYPFKENIYYDLPPKKGCGLVGVSTEAEYCIKIQNKM